MSMVTTRGRFSIIKKCVEKKTGRDVAAKLVTKKLIERQGVETEYNTLQSLQHPNLIEALDVFNTSGSHVIIMELWVSVARIREMGKSLGIRSLWGWEKVRFSEILSLCTQVQNQEFLKGGGGGVRVPEKASL